MRNRLSHIVQQDNSILSGLPTGISAEDLIQKISRPPYNIRTAEDLFLYDPSSSPSSSSSSSFSLPHQPQQQQHGEQENENECGGEGIGEELHAAIRDAVQYIKWRLLQRHAIPMKNACDLLDMSEHMGECHTSGCSDLDRLLGGGFFSGQVTELVGKSCTGKTQLCMTAAMACVSNNMINTVLYIDTTNSVSAERMRQIFLHRKREQMVVGQYLVQHPEMHERLACPFPTITEETGQVTNVLDALSRIYIRHAFDYLELLDLLKQLAYELKSSNRSASVGAMSHVRMVVIDSIASVILPILVSKDSHEFTAQIGELIRRISKQYNIAFIVTNYTVVNIKRKPSSDESSLEENDDTEEVKGALGSSWKRVPDVRLWLYSNAVFVDRIVRSATLQTSINSLTDTPCQFAIENAGVKTTLPPFVQRQIDKHPLPQS